MSRKRAHRRRGRDKEQRLAPGSRRSRSAAPSWPRGQLARELIRYAIVCGVLFAVATPLGIAVAFFWGISLVRRFQAPAFPLDGWEPGASQLPIRVEEAPPLAPLRLAELLEREWAPRAARFAEHGVATTRDLEGEGATRGDAARLGFAIGDLLDAGLAQLEGCEKPHLQIELGENLAGSEVWLRLRGRVAGPAAGSAREGVPLQLPELAAADRVLRAHGGRLEALAETRGFELLVTLPERETDRP